MTATSRSILVHARPSSTALLHVRVRSAAASSPLASPLRRCRCHRWSSTPSVISSDYSSPAAAAAAPLVGTKLPTSTGTRHYSVTTAAAAAAAAAAASNNNNTRGLTLRRLSAPFLLLCHPDKIPSSSPSLREVNLRATQTLNGLIDTVEDLCNRCGGSTTAADSSSSNGSLPSGSSERRMGRIELQARYEVEFLVPSSTESDSAGGASGRKRRGGGRDGRNTYTRRSVVVTFPRCMRDDVQAVDDTGRYSVSAAAAVRRRTIREIVRLLKVAGAVLPEGATDLAGHYDDDNATTINAQRYGHDDALMEEMDLTGAAAESYLSRTRFGSTAESREESQKSMSKYEQSRRKFMDTVDWAQHRRRTEKALRDAEADVATRNMLGGGSQERREQLVSNILARVTIDPHGGVVDRSSSNINNAEDDETEGCELRDSRTDEEKGLDPIHQLIALRRLSLLLANNYDDLQMENMGKLWDNTSIVLTPERSRDSFSSKDESGNTIVQSSAAYGIPRHRNPLIAGRESGFKFMYGSDGGITIYIPVDFTDDDLLVQMKANVWDFYNICGDGLEDLYPKFMRMQEAY